MKRSCPQRIGCPAERTINRHRFDVDDGALADAISMPVSAALDQLPHLDLAVSTTRNHAASMTTLGTYGAPQISGSPFVIEPRRTCLRFQPNMLGSALLSRPIAPVRKPVSMHFLDSQGQIVHETYLTTFDDDLNIKLMAPADADIGQAASEMPHTGSIEDWRQQPRRITPTHGAFADVGAHIDWVLADNGITRRASLPAWGGSSAWQIDLSDLIGFFSILKDAWMPIGIAVGNAGLVQYHQGVVDGLRRSANTVRISSRPCEVTIALDELEEAWVTCIRLGSRTQHMLELYDWRYHCIAQITDADDCGTQLSACWQQFLNNLPRYTQ